MSGLVWIRMSEFSGGVEGWEAVKLGWECLGKRCDTSSAYSAAWKWEEVVASMLISRLEIHVRL